MKKFSTLITGLVMALLPLSFTACGDDDDILDKDKVEDGNQNSQESIWLPLSAQDFCGDWVLERIETKSGEVIQYNLPFSVTDPVADDSEYGASYDYTQWYMGESTVAIRFQAFEIFAKGIYFNFTAIAGFVVPLPMGMNSIFGLNVIGWDEASGEFVLGGVYVSHGVEEHNCILHFKKG